MNYYSQAGQDRFAAELLLDSDNRKGIFLDIGCAGLSISNTLGLEEIGWRGYLIDNSEEAKKDSSKRPSTFILADATKLDWSFLPDQVDYLSLDIDEATLAVLKNLPFDQVKFKVITIEHDAYRFGDGPRSEMRKILSEKGYKLICEDVSNPWPFEDWWVTPELEKKAERFKSASKQWQEIFV